MVDERADEKATDKTSTQTAEAPGRRRFLPRRERGTRTASAASPVDQTRTVVAQVVWLVAVVGALFLAVGALLVAIDANADNALVGFVLDGAGVADLDLFSRTDGIKQFDGENATTLNALVNWGLGAILYLVVGRILERVIRPGRAS